MATLAPYEGSRYNPSPYDRQLHSGGTNAGDEGGAIAPYTGGGTGGQQGGVQGLGNWSDPFGYTNSSLLTPWTQKMPDLPQGGGGGISMDPFKYHDLNYSVGRAPDVNIAAFNSPVGQLSYDPYAAAGRYTPQSFSYNGPGVPDVGAAFAGVGAVPNARGALAGQPGVPSVDAGLAGVPRAFMPDRYTAAAPFQAPTLDETNDPGYAFRLKEGQRAINNSAAAQGARGGDVMKAMQDYAQNYASSEYGNVWNRAFNAYGANEGNRLAAFNADTGAQLAGQGTAFGQAMDTYNARLASQGQGWNQALGGYQAELAGQGQQYGQASNTYNTQLAAQQQGFGQQYATSEANAGRDFAAAQFNEANRANAYNTNFGVYTGLADRNAANALNAYNANTQATLGAGQINSQNFNAANALGWEAAAGMYDRNRQNAMDQWNSQYSINSANASAGANAANAQYAREMDQYRTGYDIFNANQSNQFNRLAYMANMGQQSAGAMSGVAAGYGNNVGNLYTGQANANAAAGMGSANAWANAVGGLANTAQQGLIYGSPMNPFAQPRTPGLP